MTIKAEKKPLYLLQSLQNKKLKLEVEAAKPLTHKTLPKIASEGRTETKPSASREEKETLSQDTGKDLLLME